jgi:hypothetical protein
MVEQNTKLGGDSRLNGSNARSDEMGNEAQNLRLSLDSKLVRLFEMDDRPSTFSVRDDSST